MKKFALLCVLLWGVFAQAQDASVDPALGESIVFIPNQRSISVDLETTVFKPDGAGPFPVVVINHGKSPGNNRLQSRARYLAATRQLLARGYAVVLPMRQGFSKSGGSVVGAGCNLARDGEMQAQDVKTVIAWIAQQPWADTTRMAMMGQSHGGLTTLAYGQQAHPGIKVLVNFAGGLKRIECPWVQNLQKAFAQYGGHTPVPSIWFYGENDSYFPPAVIQPAYQAYLQAGGKAQLIAYGPFGSDAHKMFSSSKGPSIWWKRVEEKFASAGLPTAVIYPQFLETKLVPAPSNFAALQDIAKVPFIKAPGRGGYQLFLNSDSPRAFAIAPSGAWGWASEGDDPLARALGNCNAHDYGNCKLYAVDDDVVWKE